MKTTLRSKFSKWLALFLPGIFLLGFNIGTGSVTSMAKAGATYGMSLLWTIVASCLATFFMISVYGRFTLVTGETALQAFRKHIHPGRGDILYRRSYRRRERQRHGGHGHRGRNFLLSGQRPSSLAASPRSSSRYFISAWYTIFSGTGAPNFSNAPWPSLSRSCPRVSCSTSSS